MQSFHKLELFYGEFKTIAKGKVFEEGLYTVWHDDIEDIEYRVLTQNIISIRLLKVAENED